MPESPSLLGAQPQVAQVESSHGHTVCSVQSLASPSNFGASVAASGTLGSRSSSLSRTFGSSSTMSSSSRRSRAPAGVAAVDPSKALPPVAATVSGPGGDGTPFVPVARPFKMQQRGPKMLPMRLYKRQRYRFLVCMIAWPTSPQTSFSKLQLNYLIHFSLSLVCMSLHELSLSTSLYDSLVQLFHSLLSDALGCLTVTVASVH